MKKYIIANFYMLILILLLACEEGPLFIDRSPDSFSFGSIEYAKVKTFYFSDTVTITGISRPTSIAFDYTTEAEIYMAEVFINDAQVPDFQSSALEVEEGDQIYMKVLSSEYYATSITTTITIGGKSDDFIITTQPLPLQRTGYPGEFFYDLKTFVLDDKVYMGLGSISEEEIEVKELYAFDIAENAWTQKTGFTGETNFSYLFSAEGKAYAGYENAILTYDPTTDSWQKTENVSLGENIASKSVFKVNEEVYALVDYTSAERKVWKFDTDKIAWVFVTPLTNTIENKHFLFSLEDQAYFRTTDTEELLSFDLPTNTWVTKKALPAPEAQLGLALQGKGYICYRGFEGTTIYEYEPQTNEFIEIAVISEQASPDALLQGLSTGQRAFILTANYSGVLGAADLSELVIYQVKRL